MHCMRTDFPEPDFQYGKIFTFVKIERTPSILLAAESLTRPLWRRPLPAVCRASVAGYSEYGALFAEVPYSHVRGFAHAAP